MLYSRWHSKFSISDLRFLWFMQTVLLKLVRWTFAHICFGRCCLLELIVKTNAGCVIFRINGREIFNVNFFLHSVMIVVLWAWQFCNFVRVLPLWGVYTWYTGHNYCFKLGTTTASNWLYYLFWPLFVYGFVVLVMASFTSPSFFIFLEFCWWKIN